MPSPGLWNPGWMREMSNKDIRKKIFEKTRRIVVKVGSSILASPEKGLQHEVFSHLLFTGMDKSENKLQIVDWKI